MGCCGFCAQGMTLVALTPEQFTSTPGALEEGESEGDGEVSAGGGGVDL